jgi:hypothetical protein
MVFSNFYSVSSGLLNEDDDFLLSTLQGVQTITSATSPYMLWLAINHPRVLEKINNITVKRHDDFSKYVHCITREAVAQFAVEASSTMTAVLAVDEDRRNAQGV